MTLFDEIERTETGPARESDPDFTYLDRSARPEAVTTRTILEDWFARCPDSEKPELRARFRSDINAQHRAACFELALHELLQRLGYRITLHPIISSDVSKTPDFLAEVSDEDRFYLEATLATGESARESAAQARMNEVYDALNRLVDSPNFFLWLEIRGAPVTQPPARRLAAFVRANLERLDPDELARVYESSGIGDIPRWNFEYEGWEINFRPIPKKAGSRGRPGVRPIGMRSYGLQWVDHRTPLRDAIIDKAGYYGELTLPYVVAVNALDRVDQDDVMDALFGQEQHTITFSTVDLDAPASSEMTRKPNGVWTSPSGPRYTRLSGVLVATRFTVWDIPNPLVRYYHNPWAQKPYSSFLARLPQAIPEGNRMQLVDGESFGSIVALA